MKASYAPWHWWNWLYDHYPRQTLAAIALLVAMSAAASVVNNFAINHANAQRTQDNTDNAVTACENANESRQASRTLWFFVVDLASKSAPPEQVAYLLEVRLWIAKVYAPHDCDDLSKSYEIPPPPALPGAA